MSDNAGYGLRNIARESLRNMGLLGVARVGLRLTRSHYRLLSLIPVETIPHLPFKWQVLRMRPGKMDVRAVTSALRVWCRFIDKTREIDGGIAELGVRAGDSLIPAALWARNRSIQKIFYGFDSFSGWPPASDSDAGNYKNAGNWDKRQAFANQVVENREMILPPVGWIPDRFFREYLLPKAEWVQRRIAQYGLSRQVRLVEGWFNETMPGFKEPLSLIKNDSDLYESTLTSLVYLWPRLSLGGIFLNPVHRKHPGSRRALEEFFAKRPERIQLLRIAGHPGIAFVMKQCGD